MSRVREAERLPVLGLVQLAASVVLLASAWPVTKQAINLGASPIWFAVGRAGLSALVAFVVLGAMRRVRLPGLHSWLVPFVAESKPTEKTDRRAT